MLLWYPLPFLLCVSPVASAFCFQCLTFASSSLFLFLRPGCALLFFLYVSRSAFTCIHSSLWAVILVFRFVCFSFLLLHFLPWASSFLFLLNSRSALRIKTLPWVVWLALSSAREQWQVLISLH